MKNSKANWSEPNTKVFCELWVEQIRARNCCKGTMSRRGYNILADKYYISTGLKHDKSQLKNKRDQLKGLYGFWLQLNKRSGLGKIPMALLMHLTGGGSKTQRYSTDSVSFHLVCVYGILTSYFLLSFFRLQNGRS